MPHSACDIVNSAATTKAKKNAPRWKARPERVHELNLHPRQLESFARVITFQSDHFAYPPLFRRAVNESNQVDGLGNQLRLRWHSRLLDEARKPRQRRLGGIRMYRRDSARMPGKPCLQEAERLGAAHFADDDAVRAQAHGSAHQTRDICRFAGKELNEIFGGALDFEGVLDDHVSFA